ncbi:MAG TPA: signal peptidase II [Polyangiaceae bacterium]|nr:signal peptidase II [Polyangiaceae bacterium]
MSDPTEPVPAPAGTDAAALDTSEASLPSGASDAADAADASNAPVASEAPHAPAEPAGFGSVPAPTSVRPSQSPAAAAGRPTFLFLGVVAAISLVADVTSKAWAEIVLSKRTLVDPAIVLIPDHLSFTLARNRGGAWGLLENASEMVRRPFFLLVSGLAIAFIVSLYGRLGSGQRALKWGLPLVLGGALGNLSDRIIRSSVIDFIDFRANWVEAMNRGIFKVVRTWGITDHWPTFNVADVSICIGVGLMAVDMFVSKRGQLGPVSGGHLAPEPALSTGPASKPPSA